MDPKALARQIAPGFFADRARKHERRYRERLGIPDLARRLEPVVQAGPFAGLRYPPERFEDIDAPVAKLVGTYEQELHSVFEQAQGPFYDVGSADGYYAVGMALRGHPVIAWDSSRSARDLCAEVARLNGVTIDQRGLYDGAPLTGGLMLCDIEGAEVELFSADVARGLPTVLIEVHEDNFPSAGEQLRAAFAATHQVRRIAQERRERPAAIAGWDTEDQNRAMAEFRPRAMHWLLFTPIVDDDDADRARS